MVDALEELEAVDAADQDAAAISDAQTALDNFDLNGVAAKPAVDAVEEDAANNVAAVEA